MLSLMSHTHTDSMSDTDCEMHKSFCTHVFRSPHTHHYKITKAESESKIHIVWYLFIMWVWG